VQLKHLQIQDMLHNGGLQVAKNNGLITETGD
jgi:hypothetical protein